LIERDELKAELEEARAAVARAEALRERLLTGSRTQERERAKAQTEAIQAIIRQKKSRYERYEKLQREGVISADTLDEARRDVEEAEANLQAARKNEEFVNAEPLPEELDKADAEIRAAMKREQTILEMMEKCTVRAPIAGTVLRTNMKVGESFSTFMPRPIVTLADTSAFRVRAEVDERDVGKISIGQRVLIYGDAFAERKVTGTVSRLSSQMGRKTVRSGDPAEKSDRDVLEVLIDVEGRDKALVVGLRVTTQFLSGPKEQAPATP
jgi:HlyD family secretion protein